MGVGRSEVPKADMHYSTDRASADDYFTQNAAEQAALDFGRRIVDVMVECA